MSDVIYVVVVPPIWIGIGYALGLADGLLDRWAYRQVRRLWKRLRRRQ